nr:MAG TPA: hypothetical protein [Bacteriophage sp.]
MYTRNINILKREKDYSSLKMKTIRIRDGQR